MTATTLREDAALSALCAKLEQVAFLNGGLPHNANQENWDCTWDELATQNGSTVFRIYDCDEKTLACGSIKELLAKEAHLVGLIEDWCSNEY